MGTISFDDLLTKAEAAPKPHRDVDVYLDSDASVRIADLEQQIAAIDKDKRLGDARPVELRKKIDEVTAEAADSLVVLRFTKMLAEDWAEIVARSPQRLDVPVDRMYGYNIHQVGRTAAAASGGRVNGDTVEPLSDAQWDRLFALLSGHEFSRIVDAIFDLNEFGPEQRIAEAKKVSSAGTGTTSA